MGCCSLVYISCLTHGLMNSSVCFSPIAGISWFRFSHLVNLSTSCRVQHTALCKVQSTACQYSLLLHNMVQDAPLAVTLFTSTLQELPHRLQCILGLARAQVR